MYCYNIIKPKHVMPIHGEWRHLTANADLATRTGIDEDRVLIAENGVTVDLINGQAKISGRVPAGMVYVDGVTIGGESESAMNERRRLAEDGGITVLAILNTATGKLAEPIEFFTQGLVHATEWTTDAAHAIDQALGRASKKQLDDPQQSEALITKALARFMDRKYRSAPVITAVVVSE